MKQLLIAPYPSFIAGILFICSLGSCKKDNSNGLSVSGTSTLSTAATPTQLGLYEADSSIYKLLFVAVPKIGTQTVNQDLVFDTGSGGMVIDANEILPASMITSSGFNFTGDSTVVNGITITSQTSTVAYGADASSTDKVYGNLAYAQVTIGDASGSIVIKRLPFFLYYKAVNSKGTKYPTGEFDVFGVDPEYDVTFPNKAYITSPFSYFDSGTGLTKGFKMAALGTGNFTLNGNYVPNVITLGLTASDLSSSSGFTMNQLTSYANEGYAPLIPVSVTYNSKTFSTNAVYDTGTEPYSYLEDPTATANLTLLPSNTLVNIVTGTSFAFNYTTSATDYLTYIENPKTTGASASIISLEYFLKNEYLLDYTDYKLGLKNN